MEKGGRSVDGREGVGVGVGGGWGEEKKNA